MKIGIIGNMNNMYFSLARYLADEGYDCELLIFDFEPRHFHPSSDTLGWGKKIVIRQLTWGDPAGIFNHDHAVKNDVTPYSFLIGNGSAPAFLARIGRKLDLFIPYGDDLYALPFIKLVKPVRMLPYAVTAYYQRKGINACPYILFDKTNAGFLLFAR